jgi:hypothetical protein
VRRIVADAGVDLGEGYADLVGRILGPETAPEPETANSPGRGAAHADAIYSQAILALRRRLDEAGAELRGVAHITGGGLPGNVPRVLPEGLARCFTRASGRCPRSCGSWARSAGFPRPSCARPSTAGWEWSASFRRGWRDGDFEPGRQRPDGLAGRRGRGRRRPRGALFGVLTESDTEEARRGASDRGRRFWNRQQPACPARAGVARCALDAEIALVFADRPCAALDWAVEQGIETLLVPAAPRGDDAARAEEDAVLAESVAAVSPELVVLAGFMRITGPAMLAAFAGRMINLHPALLPRSRARTPSATRSPPGSR